MFAKIILCFSASWIRIHLVFPPSFRQTVSFLFKCWKYTVYPKSIRVGRQAIVNAAVTHPKKFNYFTFFKKKKKLHFIHFYILCESTQNKSTQFNYERWILFVEINWMSFMLLLFFVTRIVSYFSQSIWKKKLFKQ